MHEAFWGQTRHLVRCEWGPVGAARLAADAVVVVDVLSFTTSVSVALDRGTAVYPCPWHDERAEALAREHDAALAVGRREADRDRPWSLSAAALRRAPATERLVLPSPNGSAIAAATGGAVFAASLRNASAVGSWLSSCGFGKDASVAVVPAGERWPDGSLRPGIEDLLGAGAVLAHLDVPAAALSPEALLARSLFESLTTTAVQDAVRACASGQELAVSGYAEDVEIAVELSSSSLVPMLSGGAFRPAPH